MSTRVDTSGTGLASVNQHMAAAKVAQLEHGTGRPVERLESAVRDETASPFDRRDHIDDRAGRSQWKSGYRQGTPHGAPAGIVGALVG